MRDAPQHPEPNLQATALRYAAGDLTPTEAAAFEARLADDQDAREALSEAVRLSAAALGQEPPTPHRSFRAAIRERLVGWCPEWLSRRAYRGHPLTWASLGAVAVAGCTIIGLSLSDRVPDADSGSPAGAVAIAPPPREAEPTALAVAPPPREAETFVTTAAPAACGGDCGNTVAEIWAHLSTPDHVEKTHDEEIRWRTKIHNAALHPGRPSAPTAADHREP